MRLALVVALIFPAAAHAQDQQVGARAKAMGGSYTAFEDDPVSVWLNPAGTATQPTAVALDYQSYTLYELKISQTVFTSLASTGWSDPALIPSYLGAVFQLGSGEVDHAIGLCFAAPFRTKYAFLDTSTDLLTQMTQSYYRFRASYAYDFRLRPRNQGGFFPHFALGGAVDLAVTGVGVDQYDTNTSTAEPLTYSFTAVGPGAGLGLLLGVYDNLSNFKINLGVAYQSQVEYNFSVSDTIFPQFGWPNQVNGGATVYLLDGLPLRLTFDVQWINWDAATDDSTLSGAESFRDVFNFSSGGEYRIKITDNIRLFPRLGIRVFEAPWNDPITLPAIGHHQLFIETERKRFTIFTFGIGVAWSTAESGKLWRVDLAGDVGGDAGGFAFGFSLEL